MNRGAESGYPNAVGHGEMPKCYLGAENGYAGASSHGGNRGADISDFERDS